MRWMGTIRGWAFLLAGLFLPAMFLPAIAWSEEEQDRASEPGVAIRVVTPPKPLPKEKKDPAPATVATKKETAPESPVVEKKKEPAKKTEPNLPLRVPTTRVHGALPESVRNHPADAAKNDKPTATKQETPTVKPVASLKTPDVKPAKPNQEPDLDPLPKQPAPELKPIAKVKEPEEQPKAPIAESLKPVEPSKEPAEETKTLLEPPKEPAEESKKSEVMPGQLMVQPPKPVAEPVQDMPKAEPKASVDAGDKTDGEPAKLGPVPEAVDVPAAAKKRPSEDPAIETASFNGVTPGETTLQQLEKTWGKAKEARQQQETTRLLYSIEPFKHIELICAKEKVSTILIRFDTGFPSEMIIKSLELDDIRSVEITNDVGETLGRSFPERGVVLAYAPAVEPLKPSNVVTQILIDPVSAEPFVLRAEMNVEERPSLAMRDLDRALKLRPAYARAHWLRSRIFAASSDLDQAMREINDALHLEPSNPQFHLTRAQILGRQGESADAVREADRALQTSIQRPHLRARAYCVLGDLHASAPVPDFKQAIANHNEAIQAADNLTLSLQPAVRSAAREVLLDAHLGAAYDVAWGNWKDKDKAVERWLDRAADLAEDLSKNEENGDARRFRVAVRALAACAGARGAVDPTSWTEECVRLGGQLIDAENDAIRKSQLRRDLELALYDAVQAFQLRNDHDAAMKYGKMAIERLQTSDFTKSPKGQYLLGRLYFRLGSVYALRDQDHKTAIEWFDKALAILDKPLDARDNAELGRHGESFVTMGVVYWEAGQKEKALELTKRGAAMMQRAVREGTLEESALGLAYSNLSNMHRKLGQSESAEQFQEMASQIKRNATYR